MHSVVTMAVDLDEKSVALKAAMTAVQMAALTELQLVACSVGHWVAM